MSAARELLGGYQHIIGDLRLIPGSGGIFDVAVDDEKIFSKYACADRFPEPGELLETLTSMVAPGTRRYGT